MFVRKGIKSTRSLVAFMVVSSLLAIIAFVGCNNHNFTPVAEISVLPSSIDYSSQQSANNSRQVLVTNDSVSAKLEIYEINFKDGNGTSFSSEMKQIADQSDLLKSLKDKRADGTAITYSTYPSVIVSDVTCSTNADCHCDASNADCTDKETMGENFQCVTHPTNKNKTVCQAYYEYYNNTGEVKISTWGGESTFTCTEDSESDADDASCNQYGSEYTRCKNNVCLTDIKQHFSVEYGLEQLIAITNDVVSNKDKAARWKSTSGRALCLKKTDLEGNIVYQENYEFFGLNRCDQMALKQKVNAINDGQQAVGYELYPKLQSTYRVLTVPNGDFDDPNVLSYGQSEFIVFCDDKTPISYEDVVLEDPIDITETCLSTDGLFKTDQMSVASVDDVKFDELPLRVLYEPDSDFEPGEIVSSKNFNMGILSSAKVGGQYERDVQLTFGGSLGMPPIPVITISENQQNPVPLDKITIRGDESYSPHGESRKPFSYWWEWDQDGKPVNATDAVLIASNGNFDEPVSIMNKWTSESTPKIYFPIAGTYKIRLKVRDSSNEESGPNENCADCPEWDSIEIKVRPSNKIHIELTWDKGQDVDFDMLLVKYREDGTFATFNPSSDKGLVEPLSTAMPSCTGDTDCFGGKLSCVGGYCKNSCTADADCTAIDLGWYCDTSLSQCVANDYIACEKNTDCPADTFCNPVKIQKAPTTMMCTKYSEADHNDTCSYVFKYPRWGGYNDPSDEEMACDLDDDCNGVGDEIFSCSNDVCDFSCDTSSECLTYSEQFVCSADTGYCLSNETTDDPNLDIDDVNGWGPENISVEDPASGLYRVVVRFYADPEGVVSGASPSSSAKATVQIYLNGDAMFKDGITHEFYQPPTFWKVADIYWDKTLKDNSGDGEVAPICAGWTNQECDTDSDCQDMFSNDFACAERVWEDKYCTSCTADYGTPEECEATISCASDADCAGEDFAKNCTTIKNKYCKCDGSNPFGSFTTDHYANPYIDIITPMLTPTGAEYTGSIWCDSATQSTIEVPKASVDGENMSYENVDLFSTGGDCSSIYSPSTK